MMRARHPASPWLLLGLLLLFGCPEGTSVAVAFRAGAAVEPLDVPVGHSHGGYLQSRRLGAPFPEDDPGSPFASVFPATRGIQSAPRAKALVLESRGSRLVLASVDVAFITSTLTGRVRHHVQQATGVDPGQELILVATHTHAGPGRFSDRSLSPGLLSGEPEGERHALAHGIDTFSEESTDRIAKSVARAIVAAGQSLRPARLGWAQGKDRGASRDRRCHDDWLYGKGDRDDTVTVLKVEDEEDGSPIAVLIHFALHGTLYDWNNRNLSVDAPGHVEYMVERHFDSPVVAIFLQGAAATVSPSGDRAGHTASQAMVRVGWDVARTATELLDSTVPLRQAGVKVEQRWVRLDRATLGYRSAEFPEYGAMLCHFLDSSCRQGPKDGASLDCLGKGLETGSRNSTHLAAARIGDLGILTLPGEPSPEISRQLVSSLKQAGFSTGLVLGYALDHDGYLLLEDDWLSGGSETNITFWGWKHGSYVVERSRELLSRLAVPCTSFDWEPSCGDEGRRFDVSPPPMTPFSSKPHEPTDSSSAPAIEEDTPEQLARMEEIRFAFLGGDPALGTPEVRLQRKESDATFRDVLINGWIPVSNLHGPEIPLFYESSPTYKEAPAAHSRTHRWEAVYEAPRDLPVGTYRFQATGSARVDGVVSTWILQSAPFELTPSTALRTATAIADGAAHVTLLYPERIPTFSSSPRNTGWQLGGFRPVDPRFRPDFVPVLDGVARGPIVVDGGEVPVAFEALPIPGNDSAGPWPPSEGPAFRAAIGTTTGPVEVPPGTLCDGWGNCNGPSHLPALGLPPSAR